LVGYGYYKGDIITSGKICDVGVEDSAASGNHRGDGWAGSKIGGIGECRNLRENCLRVCAAYSTLGDCRIGCSHLEEHR